MRERHGERLRWSDDTKARVVERSEQPPGLIGRMVVANDELEIVVRLREDRTHGIGDERRPVPHGQRDGDARAQRARSATRSTLFEHLHAITAFEVGDDFTVDRRLATHVGVLLGDDCRSWRQRP